MSEHTGQFHAKDAFIYTDTYRSGIRKQAAILKEELEMKQKRLWEQKEVPAHFYAELRALEDALRHSLKGADPDWVILGDPAAQQEDPGQKCDPEELESCQKSFTAAVEERIKIEQQLKQSAEYVQELKNVIVEQRQGLVFLERKLEQNSSTFMVILATMFLVIIVQLYLIWKI